MDKTKCTCGDNCQCTPDNHCGCGGHEHNVKKDAHDHDHCGCGCGDHDHDHDHDHFSAQVMNITLDDNTELECVVLAIFEVEGIADKEYIALLPNDVDDESEEGDVFIYIYKEDADGGVTLDNIEDDTEFERVADVFDQIMEEDE